MQKFKVTGMSCAACSARVEKAVSNVAGVAECNVNLLTGDMTVNDGADKNAVIKAVERFYILLDKINILIFCFCAQHRHSLTTRKVMKIVCVTSYFYKRIFRKSSYILLVKVGVAVICVAIFCI